MPTEAPSKDQLAAWTADINKLTNGRGGEVIAGWMVDLDRDDKKEAVLITSAAMPNPSAYVIDVDAGYPKYFSIGLNTGSGAPNLIAFDLNGGRYVGTVYVPPKADGKTVFKAVRYDGYTFLLDQYR